MLTKKQLFTRGMLDISPHMLSVIPFGIICGAIGVELGFDPLLVYAMSIIIFGGASQIVFLQLLSGGASGLVAATSVGVINSRHLLYGAVLSEYLEKLSLIKKLLISYIIVDQGFAESNKFFKKNKINLIVDQKYFPISNNKISKLNVEFSASFGRQLEYYTGMVFKIDIKSKSKNKNIINGGRYDKLISDLGSKKQVSAVGAALNINY